MRQVMIAVAAAGILLGGCAGGGVKDQVSKSGELSREWTEQGFTENYVFSTGIGAADQSMQNKTQRMATSRQAAVVTAQYNMISLIKGVTLEGGITVEKAMETDSNLTTKIDAEIKGAQIAKTEYTSDDGCVVTLRLPKRVLKSMGIKAKDFE